MGRFVVVCIASLIMMVNAARGEDVDLPSSQEQAQALIEDVYLGQSVWPRYYGGTIHINGRPYRYVGDTLRPL